jgi:hypothetical protein
MILCVPVINTAFKQLLRQFRCLTILKGGGKCILNDAVQEAKLFAYILFLGRQLTYLEELQETLSTAGCSSKMNIVVLLRNEGNSGF